jgi:hypothetical protein
MMAAITNATKMPVKANEKSADMPELPQSPMAPVRLVVVGIHQVHRIQDFFAPRKVAKVACGCEKLREARQKP